MASFSKLYRAQWGWPYEPKVQIGVFSSVELALESCGKYYVSVFGNDRPIDPSVSIENYGFQLAEVEVDKPSF